jgi:hypothetical protein
LLEYPNVALTIQPEQSNLLKGTDSNLQLTAFNRSLFDNSAVALSVDNVKAVPSAPQSDDDPPIIIAKDPILPLVRRGEPTRQNVRISVAHLEAGRYRLVTAASATAGWIWRPTSLQCPLIDVTVWDETDIRRPELVKLTAGTGSDRGRYAIFEGKVSAGSNQKPLKVVVAMECPEDVDVMSDTFSKAVNSDSEYAYSDPKNGKRFLQIAWHLHEYPIFTELTYTFSLMSTAGLTLAQWEEIVQHATISAKHL